MYSTALRVMRDPRVSHTLADRQAQYELALKLYGMLGQMTSVVQTHERHCAARSISARGGLQSARYALRATADTDRRRWTRCARRSSRPRKGA